MRLHTATETQANVSEGFEKLTQFLGIVGLVALLLGGVGVASGVHAFVTAKIDVGGGAALPRRDEPAGAADLLAAGGGDGAARRGGRRRCSGSGSSSLLPHVAASILPVRVAIHLDPRAIVLGLSVGVWVAITFALWPLVALRRVSTAADAPPRSGRRRRCSSGASTSPA